MTNESCCLARALSMARKRWNCSKNLVDYRIQTSSPCTYHVVKMTTLNYSTVIITSIIRGPKSDFALHQQPKSRSQPTTTTAMQQNNQITNHLWNVIIEYNTNLSINTTNLILGINQYNKQRMKILSATQFFLPSDFISLVRYNIAVEQINNNKQRSL